MEKFVYYERGDILLFFILKKVCNVLFLLLSYKVKRTYFASGLPEKERNVFIRRYFYTDSIKDISKRYHISENNVRVMLNRTRNKLRIKLEKEGYLS